MKNRLNQNSNLTETILIEEFLYHYVFNIYLTTI